jgi:quinol monooxygenase YgiN
MIDKNMNYFLIISGQISGNKRKEFEQTFRLAFSSLSDNCIERCLSEDTSKEGNYYFFSLWSDENAMKIFKGSMEFQLMNGAFHALGFVIQTINGNVVESQRYIGSY